MICSRKTSALTALLMVLVCVGVATLTASPGLAQESDIVLLPDYDYEVIYRPPMAGLSGVVASHDGTVYVRHIGSTGGVVISQLDVDAGVFTDVVSASPGASVSTIVGGPEDTVFVSIDGEFRKFSPDGTYDVWGSYPAAVLPVYYIEDGQGGHMFGISDGGSGVAEFFPDGSYDTLLAGLNFVYDLVVASDGTIFIADMGAGELIELSPTGTYTTVTQIVQDNTDLALDQTGDLYLNNAQAGFAKVDTLTGLLTKMEASSAPCDVVKSPADVAFDDMDRAVFGSWVDNELTWVNFTTGYGEPAVDQPWSNSSSADIGPDDRLYLAVDGCGTFQSSQIEWFDADGTHGTYLDGLVGKIHGLAFDSSGGMYFSLGTDTSSKVYLFPQGALTATEIYDSIGVDMGSLAVHPTTQHVFVYAGQEPGDEIRSVVIELSATVGLVEDYHFQMPMTPTGVLLDFAPDDTLYACTTERERFMSGPEVERWILSLNLETETAKIEHQIDRIGCCPMGSFSVDREGYIWWLLNPDFLLYQITPNGTERLFAENLPVDPGYVNRNSNGDIFLNSPDGLYRIWQWAPHRFHVPLALRQ